MKLKEKIKLKHKLLIGLLFTYVFLIALAVMSYKNLKYLVHNSSTLETNIYMQNGILKIKEYILSDIDYINGFASCETEQELDNLWFEHNLIVTNINAVLDTLIGLDAGQTDDIIDLKKIFKSSVVEKQKSLYKEKIRQIIQQSQDSTANISNEGLVQEIVSNINYIKDKKLSKLEEDTKVDLMTSISSAIQYGRENKIYLVVTIVVGALIYVLFMYLFVKIVFSSLGTLTKFINRLQSGELALDDYRVSTSDEIGRLGAILHHFVSKVKELSIYLSDIGDANFDNSYELMSEQDELGQSFLKMKKSLQLANEEAKKLKEQEDLQNWATIGIAKFGDILRQQTNSNEELSYNIIKALIEYIDANQGGLFIVNDEEHEPILELMATYAYGRKKFKQKSVRFGEGLVGTCALETQTIHMTNIPEDYIEIESYLGHANPKSLLIVPLKLEDKLFGIIEIASFNDFQEHEVKFIEDLAETIASTLSTAKINAKTAELLEVSKQQSEAMLAQEEEMRQNLEELQSTQEEAARREKILQEELAAAKDEINELKILVERYRK